MATGDWDPSWDQKLQDARERSCGVFDEPAEEEEAMDEKFSVEVEVVGMKKDDTLTVYKEIPFVVTLEATEKAHALRSRCLFYLRLSAKEVHGIGLGKRYKLTEVEDVTG